MRSIVLLIGLYLRKEPAMPRDDLSAIRTRLAAGEHLSADEWQLLMEHEQFAHQISDLTLEYLVALVCRKQNEQRRGQDYYSAA
jgi:hypothetical protein